MELSEVIQNLVKTRTSFSYYQFCGTEQPISSSSIALPSLLYLKGQAGQNEIFRGGSEVAGEWVRVFEKRLQTKAGITRYEALYVLETQALQSGVKEIEDKVLEIGIKHSNE